MKNVQPTNRRRAKVTSEQSFTLNICKEKIHLMKSVGGKNVVSILMNAGTENW